MKYLYETHFHTEEVSPCGNISAADGVRMYKDAGYSGVLVTDHISRGYLDNNYRGNDWKEKIDYYLRGYREAKKYETPEFSVMLGMEVRLLAKTNGENECANDYVIFGLTEEFLYENENFVDFSIKDFKKLAGENNLTVVQAHPFRPGMTVVKPNCIDGMEVFNGNRRHDSSDEIARAWAERFGLMMSSGSDFHEREDLARGGIYFDVRVSTSKELRREFLKGNYTLKIL